MAKFPNITITQEGLNAIAKPSENKLIYTHIALGDGVLNKDDKILNFTDLKSKKIIADIADITNDSNSQITLQTIVSNKIVEKGFYAREIGIYAKLGENGKEFLYGYANAGNNADYMPDNTQPIDELKLKITLLVGNVDNVTAVINSSIIFITLEECRREIKKHNDDITAHGDTFAKKKDVYTKSETDNLLKGKANTSHGNHVPKTETANNTRFLRNDNVWADVTANNIGAPTKTGAGASGTWNINITGNADVAKTLEVTDGVGAKSNGVFHWVGQNGQPAWLWGANTKPSETYVYDPSNFHVAAANTAAIADKGNWQYKNDNRWYQTAFSLDGEFNWNSTFQYNPASNVLKVGTVQGNITGNANTATNADTVDGYHAADLLRTLAGNKAPVMTDIFDRAGTIDLSAMNAADKARHKTLINKSQNMAQNLWNNTTGIVSYGGDTDMANGYARGTLKLTQSYKNFDKILVVASNDSADMVFCKLWDVWELAYMFSHSYKFSVCHCYGLCWYLFGSVRTGTATNYVLSTDTIWNCGGQNCGIIAIYGIKY